MNNLSDREGRGLTRASDAVLAKRLRQLKDAGVTFPKVAKELAAIAFSTIEDYVTVAEGGELQARPFNEIDTKKLKAVKKIKENSKVTESKDGEQLFKFSTVEYELYDKVGVLTYFVKLLGEEPATNIVNEHQLPVEIQEMIDKIAQGPGVKK